MIYHPGTVTKPRIRPLASFVLFYVLFILVSFTSSARDDFAFFSGCASSITRTLYSAEMFRGRAKCPKQTAGSRIKEQ